MDKGKIARHLGLTASMIFMLLAAHAAEEVTDTARKQGLAKAPALVKSAGIACTVTDARKLPARTRQKNRMMSGAAGGGGDSVTGAANGAAAKIDVSEDSDGGSPAAGEPLSQDEYEVVCGEGLGYMIKAVSRQTPSASLCIEQLTPPCELAGNSVVAQLQAVNTYLAKSDTSCDAINIRSVGHNAESTVIEAACSNGDGYVLMASNPLKPDQPVKAVDCMTLAPDGKVRCELTDATAQLLATDALMQQAQPECRVAARRYMGTSTTNNKYFEFRCADSKSYVLKRSAAGTVIGVAPCTDPLVANLGGCKLGSAAQ